MHYNSKLIMEEFMELKEALEYADTIIKMGKKKGHTSKNIKNSILTYTDILSDEGSITDDDARVLEIVSSVSFLDSTSDLCKRI